MKKLLLAVTSLSLLATPCLAATRCRDTHGKFIKCSDQKPKCRDAKGHFAKCGTKGAHLV